MDPVPTTLNATSTGRYWEKKFFRSGDKLSEYFASEATIRSASAPRKRVNTGGLDLKIRDGFLGRSAVAAGSRSSWLADFLCRERRSFCCVKDCRVSAAVTRWATTRIRFTVGLLRNRCT